jgi:hypothetical protein
LSDNGIQNDGNLTLVCDTAAGTNLRALATISNANTVAEEMLRSGVLARPYGVSIRESSQISLHTKGTGTNYQTNLIAGYPIGSKSIAADTGSGTIIAGDVLTNSTSSLDANKYVVGTTLAAGSLAINDPGLLVAWSDNQALAVGDSYTPNVMLHRNCGILVARNPIIPENANIEQLTITDPVTGLTFLMCRVVGDGMVTYRLHAMYGYKAIQAHGIAILMG